MFALGINYELGVQVHLALLGAIWAVWVLHCIYIKGYNFVYELHWSNRKDYILCDDPDFLPFHLMIGVVFALLGAVVWPIILPAVTIIGVLFGMRKFIRFQKKVDEAIESKS